MQSVSSKIWIRVAVSIFYDDNNDNTGTSKIIIFIVPIGILCPIGKAKTTPNNKDVLPTPLKKFPGRSAKGHPVVSHQVWSNRKNKFNILLVITPRVSVL